MRRYRRRPHHLYINDIDHAALDAFLDLAFPADVLYGEVERLRVPDRPLPSVVQKIPASSYTEAAQLRIPGGRVQTPAGIRREINRYAGGPVPAPGVISLEDLVNLSADRAAFMRAEDAVLRDRLERISVPRGPIY